MYPFMTPNGASIRKKLQQEKTYIPTLWTSVKEWCSADMLEYKYAENLLPIPIDQRYGYTEMKQVDCFHKKLLEQKTEGESE